MKKIQIRILIGLVSKIKTSFPDPEPTDPYVLGLLDSEQEFICMAPDSSKNMQKNLKA
jgi:hypothetical protein